MKIICKFGGTSLASSEAIRRCIKIVQENKDRKIIVVSAPGKRGADSKKVTDILISCYVNRFDQDKFNALFEELSEVFKEISSLVPDFSIETELGDLRQQIKNPEANFDFVVSRGEYLNAKIIAKALDFEFLDATKFIRFKNGELDLTSTIEVAKTIPLEKGVVVPGFYGVDEFGHIKTFSRGGSDITGSVVTRVFEGDIYENWTDVDGIYICDPKVVKDSKRVSQISFRELREMSYMGASVLHAETLLPLYDYPVPIHLKSSFSPELKGTEILKKRTEVSDKETITCITGKNDYTCIHIAKTMLDKELGYVKKITEVFESYHINISHTHSGLDNLCFFVEREQYKGISFEDFLKELKRRISADKINGYEKIALLAVIGHNLSGKVGILAKIFNALKNYNINVKTIYQSISECNIIIGLDNEQLQKGIQAIYSELIEK